jgi:putative multiple sugar transport system permease protein
MGNKNIEKKENKLSKSVNLRQDSLIIALIFLFLVFTFLTEGKNITPININNLVMQNSYIVVLAIGMLLCLLVGAIDLSVGSVVAIVTSLMGVMIILGKMPIQFAIISGIALGVLIGVVQGFFIAYVKIPAFIITLAGMLMYRGLALIILKSKTIGPIPPEFVTIGAGFVPQWFVQTNGKQFDVITLLGGIGASILLVYFEMSNRKKKKIHNIPVARFWQVGLKLAVTIVILNYITYKLASHNGTPNVLVITSVLVVFYGFITQRTIVGRHIYAVGGNPNAARLSGIMNEKIIHWVFINMGFLSSIAGIILTARMASASPKAGEGFELDAITSCFIGGTSSSGGIGNISGIVVGALIMGVINNGMSLMGVSIDWQRVIKGLVLIGAVTFDMYNKKRKTI